MGKYSNVILTDAEQQIITPAKQISASKSSVRPIQTGQQYEVPPALTGTTPKLEESYERWQERVSLVSRAVKATATQVLSWFESESGRGNCDRRRLISPAKKPTR